MEQKEVFKTDLELEEKANEIFKNVKWLQHNRC